MKEYPILSISELAKAILAGKKTQTRRVMKPQPPEWCKDFGYSCFTPAGSISGCGVYEDKGPAEKFFKCPYGRRGDKLWVKETHYLYGKWIKAGRTKSGKQKYEFVYLKKEVRYLDNPPRKICKKKNEIGWFKRPSIFMFRWASRIILEITDIRVERLQEITEEDAIKEGCDGNLAKIMAGGDEYDDPDSGLEFAFIMDKKCLFQHLWDSINFARGYGWDKNPFVWAISFKRVKK